MDNGNEENGTTSINQKFGNRSIDEIYYHRLPKGHRLNPNVLKKKENISAG